jgi:O-methyltransferase
MQTLNNVIIDVFKFFGISIGKFNVKNYEFRKKFIKYDGLYKKYKSFTMIPEYSFIDNLILCEKIREIKGDIAECGVWRGGMIASIAEVLGGDRKYYLFDSFEGLPVPGQNDGTDAFKWQANTQSPEYYNNCKAEEFYAKDAMSLSGIRDYHICKGWFNETLPGAKCNEIALLRLDGDWYESTMDCLTNLYPKVVDGGLVIIDDYYFWDGCTKAVHDYLSKNNLSERIRQTTHGVCYIIKNEKISSFL